MGTLPGQKHVHDCRFCCILLLSTQLNCKQLAQQTIAISDEHFAMLEQMHDQILCGVLHNPTGKMLVHSRFQNQHDRQCTASGKALDIDPKIPATLRYGALNTSCKLIRRHCRVLFTWALL